MTNGKLLKKSQLESYDGVYVLGVLRGQGRLGGQVNRGWARNSWKSACGQATRWPRVQLREKHTFQIASNENLLF